MKTPIPVAVSPIARGIFLHFHDAPEKIVGPGIIRSALSMLPCSWISPAFFVPATRSYLQIFITRSKKIQDYFGGLGHLN
jgi:hypothetical protein